jgi:predicted enzyme related to lactoylglutathione lyase
MLFVKDLPRMVDFYGNTFGLRLLPETRMDDWAEFDAGGCIFALHAIPAQFAQGIEIASPPKARAQAPVKLCFSVEDVSAERDRMQSMGVTFLDNPWGYCEGIDPEGNIFQLTSGSEEISTTAR